MTFRSVAALAAFCCCATPVLAQRSSGLSRVQVLALQQQLRDDGCGIQHTTGRIDATTRRALKQCQSKYNASSADPMTVLQAMNIGFGSGDTAPSMSEARSGGGAMGADTTGRAMRSGEEARESRRTEMRERRARRSTMRRDTTGMRMRDSSGMMRDTMRMRMRDTTMHMGDTTMHMGDTTRKDTTARDTTKPTTP
jgi:hypothetical protein